jgi:lysophospholipase L1-like esterase
MRRTAALLTTFMLLFSVLTVSVPLQAQTSDPAARLCADLTASTVSISIAGDSILTSAGASSFDRGAMEMLKTYGTAHGWTVWTDGARSGSYASHFAPGGQYASVIETIKTQRPTLFTMDWRVNEQWNAITPAAMRTAYLAIIDNVRSVSPTTSVLIINPWKMALDDNGGIDNYTAYKQADYRAAMWDVKVQRNTLWLDMSPFFPTGGTLAHTLLPDGIHGSDASHIALATAVLTTLLTACE